MRIGILAAETAGDQALGKLTDQLRRAADDGFASVWMSNIFGLDALTALAVAGSGAGDRARHGRRAHLPPASGGAGAAGADRGAGVGGG